MPFLRIFNLLSEKQSKNSESLNRQIKSNTGNITLSPGVCGQLERLHLNASRFLPGFSTGLRSSFRRKPSLEFREHRMYVPGDDVRYIDWNASGRQEHIYVKQGEHLKETSVYLLLDCSRSMQWGDITKAKTLLQLAAILGYLALKHGDRLSIIPFSDHLLRPIGPISGKGQIPLLLNYLQEISFYGMVNFTDISIELKQRLGQKGGLIYILSDFIDLENPQELLDIFPPPKWDAIFLHLLHPQELTPSLSGDLEFFDIETNQTVNFDINSKALNDYQANIQSWQEQLSRTCIDNNAFYALITTDGDDQKLIPQLRNLGIISPS